MSSTPSLIDQLELGLRLQQTLADSPLDEPLALSLIEQGAHFEPETVDFERAGGGWHTLAMLASNPDALRLLREALRRGANPNHLGSHRFTALHVAASNDVNIEAAELLIEAGALPDLADQDGMTPLMEACAKAQPRMASLLLASGADPGARNRHGISGAGFAWSRGALELGDRIAQLMGDRLQWSDVEFRLLNGTDGASSSRAFFDQLPAPSPREFASAGRAAIVTQSPRALLELAAWSVERFGIAQALRLLGGVEGLMTSEIESDRMDPSRESMIVTLRGFLDALVCKSQLLEPREPSSTARSRPGL